MNGSRRDAAPWLAAACAALTLSGVSALAQAPKVTLASVTAPAPPLVAMDDGDGDELLEHWGDPRYSQEQRVQLAGLALFFGAAATLSRRRRAARRRNYRDG